MKNEILSSDLEDGGKIRFLVMQYNTVVIGYRNANEFIKQRGNKYQNMNSDYYPPNTHKDLYLVIKDPRNSTIEWHLLKKDLTWGSWFMKVFEGKTYLIWTEAEVDKAGSFIRYGQITKDLELIKEGKVHTDWIYPVPSFIDILPDPFRLFVVMHGELYVINETNITKIYSGCIMNIEKSPMNHFHIINLNSTVDDTYAFEDIDENMKVVEHEIIKMDNRTQFTTPRLFLNKGIPFIYYSQCLLNTSCLVVQYFVHPTHNGTLNTTDHDRIMIANLTYLSWDQPRLVYGPPTITKDKLILYYNEDNEYPMSIQTYDVSDNFSQGPVRYFNFTIQSMYYIENEYYIVGNENRWTFQKNFPQIQIVKIDG